jgi:hypothetical protein
MATMSAMPDAHDISFDDARLRAADYRMRAEELRMRAASIGWAEARASILKVAETYDALARTIENIAERPAGDDSPADLHGRVLVQV